MKIGIDGHPEICYSYGSILGKEFGRDYYVYQGQLSIIRSASCESAASFFIQKANEFKSTIWVEKDEQRVNAKSLLGVLSLGIIKGSTIDLIADGTDEKDAVDALVELISSDFAD